MSPWSVGLSDIPTESYEIIDTGIITAIVTYRVRRGIPATAACIQLIGSRAVPSL
jgi:hypothetical protein